MKKEISQPLMVGIIVVMVLLAGVFGWFKLRNTGPEVTPQQTRSARETQMKMMQDAVMSMRGQQNTGQQGTR